jgi:hypothetical protein
MARYTKDPRWTTSRRTSRCRTCNQLMQPGARIFLYPATGAVFCEADGCGKQAARDFEAAAFDEAVS